MAQDGTTSQTVPPLRCSLIKNPAERADLKQLMVSARVYSLRYISLVCNASRLSSRYTPSSRCLKWNKWTLQAGCAAQLGSISLERRLMGPPCDNLCTRKTLSTRTWVFTRALFSFKGKIFPFTCCQLPAKQRGGDTSCKVKLGNHKTFHYRN